MDVDRRLIYLDHLASTPLDPEVRAAMLPWLDPARAGNPHSEHPAGWTAMKAVEAARASVAELIGARPSEIVFTSGATEANNLALFGMAEDARQIIVSAIEHPSVLEPAAALGAGGTPVQVLATDSAGRIDLDELEGLLSQGPALVSIMAANNEIGTLNPLAQIGALCRSRGAIFHCDAVQALTTQTIDVAALGIDLLSLSGHKLYGPQGISALYVRGGIALRPLTHGGGQQGGRRAGTLPVALCVGLGAACRLALAHRHADKERLAALRDRLARLPQRDHSRPGCRRFPARSSGTGHFHRLRLQLHGECPVSRAARHRPFGGGRPRQPTLRPGARDHGGGHR
jgi:cysteine desulfurase